MGTALTSRRPRAARGAAIVLAMLLAALAAAVAATVFTDQRRWSEAVLHRRDQVQAQALAIAGIQWARQVIANDTRSSVVDHLGETWAIPLPAMPLENGSIRGAIVDAQSRLNVNALGASGAGAEIDAARIGRLFQARGDNVALLDAIADWIDADGQTRRNGAEDPYYLALPTPALAADAPVVRLAELGAVRGVDPVRLAALSPFLGAMPVSTPVNVNTAPPEVLATLVDGLSAETLADLVRSRADKPFTTVSEFRARLPGGATLPNDLGLAVRSDYFEVTVEALQGTTQGRARALLRRIAGSWPAIVWQVVE